MRLPPRPADGAFLAEVELRRPAETPRELRELREQTALGMVFLGALMGRQLRLSLTIAGLFVVLIASQPLIAWAWPAYGALSLLGVPLPWLALAFAAYPAMVGLGLLYVRRAESIDEEFSDLLQ